MYEQRSKLTQYKGGAVAIGHMDLDDASEDDRWVAIDEDARKVC